MQAFLKSRTMAVDKIGSKSPFVPLFQREIFLREIETPLWKRGEGEILGRSKGPNLWQVLITTASSLIFLTALCRRFELRVRVANHGQVGGPRPDIQVGQQAVVAMPGFEL